MVQLRYLLGLEEFKKLSNCLNFLDYCSGDRTKGVTSEIRIYFKIIEGDIVGFNKALKKSILKKRKSNYKLGAMRKDIANKSELCLSRLERLAVYDKSEYEEELIEICEIYEPICIYLKQEAGLDEIPKERAVVKRSYKK